MSEDTTKEKCICVTERESKELAGGKTVWELTTDEGGRFGCWDKGLADAIGELPASVKVRYTEKKNGKYTNRTVLAVALLQES